MGDAIKSDAAVSLLIPLLLILGNLFFFFFFAGLITQAANQLCGDVWVQVCDSNWSASRRWRQWRRTAFVMSGERLLSSQCAFSLLLPLVASRYLWVICSLRAPPPPPICGHWPIDGSLLVKMYESSATAGGETRSWGKQIQSRPTTCHNTFHEQAGWLNHWVCGTYGATGHSEINTLWIIPTGWQAARWRTGGAGQLYTPIWPS